jgi:hypothetical protein
VKRIWAYPDELMLLAFILVVTVAKWCSDSLPTSKLRKTAYATHTKESEMVRGWITFLQDMRWR